MNRRYKREFYLDDVLQVAPALLGQHLVSQQPDGTRRVYTITETEAYRGEDDLACHASRGRTRRTEVMFREGGLLYIYFIYGMYWMMNVVTGATGAPQAVLIRGLREARGPGRLTRLIGVDGSYYGEDLVASSRIWIEPAGITPPFTAGPRVGIDYAGDPWKEKPWRFLVTDEG